MNFLSTHAKKNLYYKTCFWSRVSCCSFESCKIRQYLWNHFFNNMTVVDTNSEGSKKSLNFIEQIVENDLKEGKNQGRIATRFPPEPNGYLHIGHAKAICLDFGIAQKYGGTCNLRFDDTNPTKEDVEYVDSIMEDIRWLGFSWDNLFYASDYFGKLFQFAQELIKRGLAYVDDQSAEVIAQQRAHPPAPGSIVLIATDLPKKTWIYF